MQDFTKDIKLKTAPVPNEYGGIYDRPKKPAEPKIGFVEARLNRDNFWNLMFSIGLCIGFGVSGLIVFLSETFPVISSIIFWITLVVVPYLVKRNSKITFDREKFHFITENGATIRKHGSELIFITFLSFGFMALAGLTMDALKVPDSPIAYMILFGILLFVPGIYCILKNFPIAVFFTKEAWIVDGSTRSHRKSGYDGYKHNESLTSPSNMLSNPMNSWYSGNIYHKK